MPSPIRFFDDAGEIGLIEDASTDGASRTAMPVVVRPKCVAFRVERLEIERGQDWLVEDVLVHGKSQFRRPGSIPGDVFALPPATLGAFVSVPFDTIQTAMDFTMVVAYVGHESPVPAFACKAHGVAARTIESVIR